MKVEGTEESMIQVEYAGDSPQVHNKLITHVMVGNAFIPIIAGSFKLHRTPGGKTPFIRFMAYNPTEELTEASVPMGFEVFPNALQAVSWQQVEEDFKPEPEAETNAK